MTGAGLARLVHIRGLGAEEPQREWSMEQQDQVTHPTFASSDPSSTAERLRQIRACLPGQVLWERIDTAHAAYGPLYTLAQIQRRIGESLPARFGFRRTAICEPIETYRGSRIPDEALVKYDEAARSGLFARFWVATPTYREERQADPWILGEIEDTDSYAVIARWD